MKNKIKYKILLLSLIFLANHTSAAQMKVISSNDTVSGGEMFDLNIYVDPGGAAIAGAQLKIELNNSMINVNNIIEGNLFKQNGTDTLFYKNIINNSLVTEINVYSAILGPFNVSNPETFILINVTAIGSSGKTMINLSNVKISDPDGNYIDIFVSNGSVNINGISPDITPPASVEYLKNISYASGFINFTWTDPKDEDFVKVMVYLDGLYQSDVLKGIQYYNVTISPGTHTIGIRTVDINGNINATMEMNTVTTELPSVVYINGTVHDSITKAGISGVTVFTDTGILTTTNSSGFYSLVVTSGTYDLTISFDPEYFINSTKIPEILSDVVVQDIEIVKKPTGTIRGTTNRAPV